MVRSTVIILIFLAFLSGCPAHFPGARLSKEDILRELLERRNKFSVIEADVRFLFPRGILFTASLEGHAAYKLSEQGPLLRMVAFGSMGAQAMDLLVKDGDFLVKLPGREKPMNREDLRRVYGESVLTRAPSLLARRPGLFFGGIPEGLSAEWEYRSAPQGTWVTSPDGESYLVSGVPPVIRKAIITDDDAGVLSAKLSGWESSPEGVFPTKITVKFDKRTLFTFKITGWKTEPTLPNGLFHMDAALPRHNHKLLILNAI